tara:strand:- start:1462 stop:1755 length:294 start_codon:yes stop_codon:yes gene_type:complete
MIKWSKFATKAKKIGSKAKGAYKKSYKKYPLATGITTVSAGAAVTYPLMKDTEIVQSRVRQRKEGEKIRKEMKQGKKISFKERYKRLSDAGKMRSFP